MLYLLYIFLGLLIILGVNLLVTALHDMYVHKDEEACDLNTFKKYFVKNNNIPTKMSDIFN